MGDKIEVRKIKFGMNYGQMFPKDWAQLVDIYRLNITSTLQHLSYQSLSKSPVREKGSGRPTKKQRREFDDYFGD